MHADAVLVIDMHPTLKQLQALDSGQMAEPDASTIEDHLATCADCMALVERGFGCDSLSELIRVACRRDRAGTTPILTRFVPTGYELIEPIGRGGMGVVFKARQRALGRLVAFKQIRAGLDADPNELARFQTEAKAAARLTHPSIVRVFDVGEQDGLPYIAMELVEGGNLADRLAGGPLPPKEAATLVETLALAVHHSHVHGIVHRDLKPANILLTPELVPRITDFGLVKLDGGVGSTQTGVLLGTPRYMAPEQIRSRDAGPSVDIYALGAILYECLGGHPPFQAVAPLDVLEQIRTQEPLAVGRLRAGLPRDLQTICMKCLEKDPRRRYATAAALAADLGRLLRGEPVEARPSSVVERLAKWVRRRPYQAGLAGLAALGVIAAFAGLLLHQRLLQIEISRTAQAAELARQQKNFADGNYRDARAAIRAILDCYDDPEFATLPRRGELRRAQAEKALIFYDRLLAGAESRDPVIQLDTARASREAALTQYAAGRFQQAVASLERSVRLIDAVQATRLNDPEVMREQVLSRTRLALLAWQTRKSADSALAELHRALGIAEALVLASPRSVAARTDLAWCLHDQGSILLESGRLPEALAAHRRAVDINRELVHEQPADMRRRVVLAENLNNIGLLLTPANEPDQAEAAYSEAATLLEAAVHDKSNRRALASLGSVLNNWGNLATRRRQSELAFARFDRGLASIAEMLRREPADTTFRYAALNLHGSRANLLMSVGRHAEAIADWDRVVELNDEPAERARYHLSRILCLVYTAHYQRGADEAKVLAAELTRSNPPVAADLYNVACALAVASATAAKDQRVEPAERLRRSTALADAAMSWLNRVAGLGFFSEARNREQARADVDLASLRNRADFTKLLHE
jgi:eukaryotic-like serine/threonine-protein kinase